eukprot:8070081-Pyramimonas_sp.AAC.1
MAAKAGARLHVDLNSDDRENLDHAIRTAKAVFKLAAKLLERWLKTNLEGVPRAEAPPRIPNPASPPHVWAW